MTNKKVFFIGSDHNGISLKKKLIKKFSKQINLVDIGPFDEKNKVDYTDVAKQLGNIVRQNEKNYGILICGTGVGMSIAANKIPDCRAALVTDKYTASMSKKHNNSNILCLGSWSLTNNQEAFSIFENWMNSTWQKGRHINRVNKLEVVKGLVFTNGVFDLFHQGHFELLKFAKNCGKKLIVGIDSDKRVREIKGKFRPIIDQFSRKKILESLEIVDQVIIFNSKSELMNLYKTLKPHTIVRGDENKNIRKIDQIPSEIKIILFKKRKNISTTKIISRLQKAEIK